MSVTWLPTPQQLEEVFVDEVREAGGRVLDAYGDGRRLFLRSLLPGVKNVRAGDELQGGVALRVVGPEVEVHPYVFRQVCRNGAIFAKALESRRIVRIEGPEYVEAPEVLAELAEAVRLCCGEDAFETAADQLRSATQTQADLTLTMMPQLAGLPRNIAAQMLERFATGRDRSNFGLMNAATSVARDTADPEIRWRLEELGGELAVRLSPVRSLDGAAALRA